MKLNMEYENKIIIISDDIKKYEKLIQILNKLGITFKLFSSENFDYFENINGTEIVFFDLKTEIADNFKIFDKLKSKWKNIYIVLAFDILECNLYFEYINKNYDDIIFLPYNENDVKRILKNSKKFNDKISENIENICNAKISENINKQKLDKFLNNIFNFIKNNLEYGNELYKNIFENNFSYMMLLDSNGGQIFDINNSACNFYGYKKEEILNKKFEDLVHDKANFLDDIQKMLLEKKNHFYFKHILADNTIKDIEIYSKNIEINQKKLTFLIIHDITNKKINEEKLKKFSIIIEQSPVIILITNANGKIEYVNKKFFDLTGYSKEEVIGKSPRILRYGSHSLEFYKNLWDTILAGREWHGEFQNKKKNGEYFWESAVISSIKDEKGEITHFIQIGEDITEKKKNEEGLLINENVIAFSLNGILLVDLNFNLIYHNNAFLKIFGLENIDEYNLLEYRKEILNILKKEIFQDVNKKDSCAKEIKIEFANSNILYLQVYANYVYDKSKTPICITISIIDITERKLAEEKINEQNIFLKTILDSLSYPFYVIDINDFTVKIANSKALNTSFEKKKKCYEIIRNKYNICDIDKTNCPIELIKEKKEPVILLHENIENNKKVIYEIHAFPVFNKEGEVSDIIEYLVDVTERMSQELEKKKLLTAIEQSSNVVVITDVDGNIEFVNKAFEHNTGYKVEEVIGKNPRILKTDYLPKEVYKNLWETITAGKTWRGEFHNKRKDGTTYWENAIITPIVDNNGKIVNYMAIKEDITDKKRYEDELRQAKEEAEIANRLKSEFLANMSHEIRTPMNSILGFTELLIEEEVDIDKKEKLKFIYNSGKHLLEIINDILDFSKIEAGKITIEKNRFSIHETLDNLYKMFDIKAKEKGLDFQLNKSENLPLLILGDEHKIIQILVNILGNAFKFTEKGYVMFSCDYEDGVISFTVKDSGIGISKKKLKDIFKPFEQVDSSISRKFGGTGLGLAITRKLVELMNGEITVDSKLGAGTTFNIEIPVEIVEEDNIFEIEAECEKDYIGEIDINKMIKSWFDKFEGDAEFEEILIDGIKVLPQKISLLEDAVLRKIPKDINFISHNIKGFTGNLGMTEIYTLALEIENESKKDKINFSKIQKIFNILKELVFLIPNNLNEYITKNREADRKEHRKNFNILLAEDNEINQKLILAIFKRLNLNCDIANNGEEALKMLKMKDYDLLLLDMQMPVLDGVRTIEIIRQDEKLKDLYVIALTAYAMKGDAEKFINIGCNDYLSKPVNKAILQEKIENLLIKKGKVQ